MSFDRTWNAMWYSGAWVAAVVIITLMWLAWRWISPNAEAEREGRGEGFWSVSALVCWLVTVVVSTGIAVVFVTFVAAATLPCARTEAGCPGPTTEATP